MELNFQLKWKQNLKFDAIKLEFEIEFETGFQCKYYTKPLTSSKT